MEAVNRKEHRKSARRPIALKAILYPSEGTPFFGTIQDISFSGMFVETRVKTPPVNTQISLSFRLGAGEQRNQYRMSAVVARSTADGMGLVFEDYDEHTVVSLRRVYRETLA